MAVLADVKARAIASHRFGRVEAWRDSSPPNFCPQILQPLQGHSSHALSYSHESFSMARDTPNHSQRPQNLHQRKPRPCPRTTPIRRWIRRQRANGGNASRITSGLPHKYHRHVQHNTIPSRGPGQARNAGQRQCEAHHFPQLYSRIKDYLSGMRPVQ